MVYLRKLYVPMFCQSETDWGFARREAMRAYTPNMTGTRLTLVVVH